MNYNYNMSKKYMNKLESKIQEQEAQYDYLKDEVHCLYAEKKELQQRIDKAIEYIEQKKLQPRLRTANTYSLQERQLLDILKGSDSDGYNKE